MKALPRSWSRKLPLAAAALLFAGGNLVFFLAYRSGTSDRRASLEARRDDLRRTVESREAEAERLSRQLSRLSDVRKAMEEFYGRRIGAQEDTLAAVVSDLHETLRATGIEANQISYSTTAAPKLPLTQMRITFPVRCDYQRFKKLLRAFETGQRWIAIQSVAIRREPEQPGAVSVQMELLTYFTESQSAPASPKPQTPSPRGAVPARRTG